MAWYLEYRVLHEPQNGNPLLKSMRQLSSELVEEHLDNPEISTVEQCIQRLCSISMNSRGPKARYEEIFDRQSAVTEDEYNRNLFAAGLCTNTLPIVRRCVSTDEQLLLQLEEYTKSSLFPPFVDLATGYSDNALLEYLMTGGTTTLNRKVRTLLFVSAAKAGHMEQAVFLYNFKKDEAPWEFGRESSAHKHEIEALDYAVRSTDLETMKFIFELKKEHPTEIQRVVTNYSFMLSDCARVGRVDTASYLLSQGADARGYPEMHAPYISNDPIKGACSSDGSNMATIELLIKHGADPNVTIAAAASRGRTALVRQLLDFGITPIKALCPAAEGPFLEIVRMLLDAGVDANESTGADSPLVSAISKEHTVLFNLLIERGADIKSPGTAEECVKYAKKDGLESMLQLLEQHGVDINMPEGDDKEVTS
jgi:hypothetical protein